MTEDHARPRQQHLGERQQRIEELVTAALRAEAEAGSVEPPPGAWDDVLAKVHTRDAVTRRDLSVHAAVYGVMAAAAGVLAVVSRQWAELVVVVVAAALSATTWREWRRLNGRTEDDANTAAD